MNIARLPLLICIWLSACFTSSLLSRLYTFIRLFEKADNAMPGYENVKNLMNEALKKGMLKVVVSPVNYHSYDWSYWG